MVISLAIMAHPSREEQVKKLLDELDCDARVEWDRDQGEWDTGRRSLLAFDERAERHIVLQDDAIPCRDLVAGVEKAHEFAGNKPIGLYAGRVSPHPHIVGPAVQGAMAAGSPWLEMEGPWWGVGMALPTKDLRALVRWGDLHNRPKELRDYDCKVHTWYRLNKRPCLYTVPSLVDHPPEAGKSLLGLRNEGRYAHAFLGRDRSALEIDWSVEPVLPPVWVASTLPDGLSVRA